MALKPRSVIVNLKKSNNMEDKILQMFFEINTMVFHLPHVRAGRIQKKTIDFSIVFFLLPF